jgi:DNA-binding MarR family transcriptional regulator
MNDNLILKNQICFKHYVISKEIIKKYKPLLDPLNLTYTSYIIMLVLWEKDNISMKEISDLLYLDSGTLTPVLKKLETKGYIKRLRNKDDERLVYICLTKAGIQLKEFAKDVPRKLIESIFPGVIDEKAIVDHMSALDQIISILTTDN